MVKFKAIKLKREFDVQKVVAAARAEMNKIGPEINRDWRVPLNDWQGVKPQIGDQLDESGGVLTLFSGVISGGLGAQKMGWLNFGTQAHVIVPVNARALFFQAGYSPKTFPGVLGSAPGGAYGPGVFSHGVQHPGTAARKFDELIRLKWEYPFFIRLQAAIQRGLKATGHARWM